jgi:uncharacterized protein YndB with AHSA1/START domain
MSAEKRSEFVYVSFIRTTPEKLWAALLEIDPPRQMVIRWLNVWKPEIKAEGPGRCTIELEPKGRAVKLTITHESDRPRSKLINAVSGGWPLVISNLKSLLETGELAITEK